MIRQSAARSIFISVLSAIERYRPATGPSPDIDPLRSELEKDDRIASPFKSAYVAAKHGILELTKTVALELAEHGIAANAICPGYVPTPLVERQIPETEGPHADGGAGRSRCSSPRATDG